MIKRQAERIVATFLREELNGGSPERRNEVKEAGVERRP